MIQYVRNIEAEGANLPDWRLALADRFLLFRIPPAKDMQAFCKAVSSAE